MNSHYDVLGVDRSADTATIRKAFKQRAKATHPDAGGKRGEFEAVSLAMRVLTDERARARYDATGETVDGPDNTDAAALQFIDTILAPLFIRGDTARIDLAEELRRQAARQREETRANIRDLQTEMARLVDVRRRLKSKTGRDPIGGLLERRIARGRNVLVAAEESLRVIGRAIEILEDYSFDVDREAGEPPLTGFFEIRFKS